MLITAPNTSKQGAQLQEEMLGPMELFVEPSTAQQKTADGTKNVELSVTTNKPDTVAVSTI